MILGLTFTELEILIAELTSEKVRSFFSEELRTEGSDRANRCSFLDLLSILPVWNFVGVFWALLMSDVPFEMLKTSFCCYHSDVRKQ